jgi:hypothetical protein
MLATILALFIATASADCIIKPDSKVSAVGTMVVIDDRTYNLRSPKDTNNLIADLSDCNLGRATDALAESIDARRKVVIRTVCGFIFPIFWIAAVPPAMDMTNSRNSFKAIIIRSTSKESATKPAKIVAPKSGGACCKECGPSSKPCGGTCIPVSKTCHTSGGCAC